MTFLNTCNRDSVGHPDQASYVYDIKVAVVTSFNLPVAQEWHINAHKTTVNNHDTITNNDCDTPPIIDKSITTPNNDIAKLSNWMNDLIDDPNFTGCGVDNTRSETPGYFNDFEVHKNQLGEGWLKICYCPTKKMAADHYTKQLQSTHF